MKIVKKIQIILNLNLKSKKNKNYKKNCLKGLQIVMKKMK